jgi:hypothetical protein
MRCATCGEVFTARAPEEAQGPKYDESAASMMGLLRYGTGLPLFRLGRLQQLLGIPVPPSTQWEVVAGRLPALLPVYEALLRCAATGSVVHNDDTYMRILELMGKRRAKLLAKGELPDPDRTGLFTTAIVSVTTMGPIAMFFTGRKHAGENLTTLLDDRPDGLEQPIHMCDGLDRNRPKEREVVESNCLAHGRRHIVDEAENFPSECRHVLEQLREVFHNEAVCKEQGWSGQERLEFHQQHSAPIMEDLQAWMKAQFADKRIEPNSGLGDAFKYLLKRWHQLTLFLRVADAPMDNNLCERVIKMAIKHRKNSYFYKTQRGARVGDIYMTLIYTAELAGENPFEYLTAILRHETMAAAAPDEWLPWSYRATLARLVPEAA